MRKTYGPLELVSGRWVVGDSHRPDGCWVEFRTEGMVRLEGGAEDEVIPWSKVMLGIGIQIGHGTRGSASEGELGLTGILGGLPGPFKGRGGGHLSMTLRHPYEDRKLTFDRHAAWYKPTHILLLAELMTQTVAAGDAHRLGDADWLAWAVGRLELVTSWPIGRQPAAVVQAALKDE
ncbi:hypothetical protein [Kitasatospora sp. MBT63]|uniref:hypothetical protein n=1 Tax=Kitasatospora sp. MBT63 TaxID=1444768 RepID=UPI001314346A|nr:hypothetical protein [Kitasatospora sp. MBT63]